MVHPEVTLCGWQTLKSKNQSTIHSKCLPVKTRLQEKVTKRSTHDTLGLINSANTDSCRSRWPGTMSQYRSNKFCQKLWQSALKKGNDKTQKTKQLTKCKGANIICNKVNSINTTPIPPPTHFESSQNANQIFTTQPTITENTCDLSSDSQLSTSKAGR